MECLVCKEYKGKNKNGLATHLRLKHNISYPEYDLQYMQGLELPKCPECGSRPRYDKTQKRFMEYCVEHANLARSKWSKENKGKIFGGNPGWKKGVSKEKHPGIAAQAEWMKDNNPFYQLPVSEQKKAHAKAAQSRKISRKVFDSRNFNFIEAHDLKIISPYEEYSTRSENLRFQCLKCSAVFERSMGNMIQYEGNCPTCRPTGTSKAEQEIADFIKSLGIKDIETNVRDIITPKELDIYIPSHKYAIEYNGLYWHSEQFRDKNAHKEKTDLCEASGVKLFHIWSDHWQDKKSIVKSMIRHHLNMNSSVYPRKLQLKKFELNKEFDFFFESNHLHGHAQASVAFALVKGDEIYSCLSLRKNKTDIEIARFAVRCNTHVPGAFSKLLKEAKKWAKSEGYKRLISYSYNDAAYSNLYESNGFTFVHDTKLDYFYTDGKQRYHRFKYRAQDAMAERAIASKNNVERVYGCGNKLWEYKIL